MSAEKTNPARARCADRANSAYSWKVPHFILVSLFYMVPPAHKMARESRVDVPLSRSQS